MHDHSSAASNAKVHGNRRRLYGESNVVDESDGCSTSEGTRCKRRRLASQVCDFVGQPSVRSVAAQATSSMMAASACALSNSYPCPDRVQAFTSYFFGVLSASWGADVLYQVGIMVKQGRIPAAVPRLQDDLNSLINTAARAAEKWSQKLSATCFDVLGRGQRQPEPEEVWRA